MISNLKFKVLVAAGLAIGVASWPMPAAASPSPSAPPSLAFHVQQNRGGGGGQNRGGGGQSRGGAPQRSAPQQSQPQRQSPPQRTAPQRPAEQPSRPPQPAQHARRDVVRTNNYVPRPGMPPVPPTRGTQVNAPPRSNQGNQPGNSRGGSPSPRVVNQRQFTKTPQGRQYDNGVHLRKGVKVTATWERRYFPHGYVHFPYYRPSYVRGNTFYSPFGFYFGVGLPYISASICHVYPPSVVFIDEPVYNGDNWQGWQDDQDRNWINDSNLDNEEPGLSDALDELNEAYQSGNIDGLVALVDPSVSVAVYERGNYQYTLAANDYLDLSRDALRSLQTISFSLDTLHQRANGIFSVAGHHVYKDAAGGTRTVYVDFVLQDVSGHWTLTQVGTSPDVIQNL